MSIPNLLNTNLSFASPVKTEEPSPRVPFAGPDSIALLPDPRLPKPARVTTALGTITFKLPAETVVPAKDTIVGLEVKVWPSAVKGECDGNVDNVMTDRFSTADGRMTVAAKPEARVCPFSTYCEALSAVMVCVPTTSSGSVLFVCDADTSFDRLLLSTKWGAGGFARLGVVFERMYVVLEPTISSPDGPSDTRVP